MKALSLLVIASLTTGCYVGRTPGAKRTSYVLNGTVAALGGAMLLSVATEDGCPPGADVSCGVGMGVQAAGTSMVGMTLLGGAALGLLITAIVPTRHDDPMVIVTQSRVPPSAFSFAPAQR